MEDWGTNSGMDVSDLSPSISIAELESMAHMADLETALLGAPTAAPTDNAWVTFEAEVRSAHATALARVRQYGGERCAELLRLLEIEEQTRCHAFQETQLGEVRPAVYQSAVRSILEKLLGKLETMGYEPALYQGAAQCLSEYMSALNHHSELVQVVSSPKLPAILEGCGYGDFGESASDKYSERSDDTDTLSVHSDQVMGGEPTLGASGACGMALAVDLAELRKERRRESNKRAATKYRNKRVQSTQQVLAESAALRQQMSALSEQNAVMAAENRLLKQQVAFLQGMLNPVAQHASAAQAVPTAAVAPVAAGVAMLPATSDGAVSVQAFPEGGGGETSVSANGL